MGVHVCACMHVHMGVCACVHVHVCGCMHVCVRACACAGVYVCVRVCVGGSEWLKNSIPSCSLSESDGG